MSAVTIEDIEEHYKHLRDLYEEMKYKLPEDELKYLEYLGCKESEERHKLYFKLFNEKRDEPLSDEEEMELRRKFEDISIILDIKFNSLNAKE